MDEHKSSNLTDRSAYPRRRILLVAVGLIVIILIAIGSWLLGRSRLSATQAQTFNPDIRSEQPLRAAIQQFEAAIKLEPANVEAYRYLSLAYRMAGQFDAAVGVWERAAEANPGQTWPLVELGKLYESVGLHTKARSTYIKASDTNPQDDAANRALVHATQGVAATQAIQAFMAERVADQTTENARLVLVNAPQANGWTFLGFHGDEKALADGAEGTIWTFWQAPTVDVKPSIEPNTWFAVAPGIWGRPDAVRNLLSGGDFESSIIDNQPRAFPNDVYNASPLTRQVRRIEKDGAQTTVAALINDPVNRNTSFTSSGIPIKPNVAYLLSGDAYSAQGAPRIGWRWVGELPEDFTANDGYADVVNMRGGWQQYVGLAVPPPGTASFQAWLLNSGSQGLAYFDDVVLATIPAPSPLWPGVPSAETQRAERYSQLIAQLLAYPEIADDLAWQAEIVSVGPLIRVDQQLASGWIFQGYFADEAALASGIQVPLLLFFEGPVGASPGPREQGWIDLQNGEWLLIALRAENLTPSGDFEHGLEQWATDIFSSPVSSRVLSVSLRSGITTTVGVLSNTLSYSTTSFVSSPITVTPGTIYLQSGWLLGSEARNYFGRQWKGEYLDVTTPTYSYVVGSQSPRTWTRYAGIAEPPPRAETMEVWLLNYLSMGVGAFDNVSLVALPAPQFVSTTQAAVAIGSTLAFQLFNNFVADPGVLNDESWISQLADAGPTTLMGKAYDENWTLVGYTTDEAALAAGATAPAFFFWRGPAGAIAGVAEDGWYSLDTNLWVHIVEGVTSILPNGNLENTTDELDSAIFPLDYATNESARDRLATELRGNDVTTVAALANATSSETNGIASAVLPVEATQDYLLAAWVRTTDGGNAVLGVNWVGDTLSPDSPTAEFATINQSPSDWTHVSDLFAPLPGSSGLQVAAYNHLASGVAQFDDIIVIPVQLPEQASAGSTNPAGVPIDAPIPDISGLAPALDLAEPVPFDAVVDVTPTSIAPVDAVLSLTATSSVMPMTPNSPSPLATLTPTLTLSETGVPNAASSGTLAPNGEND